MKSSKDGESSQMMNKSINDEDYLGELERRRDEGVEIMPLNRKNNNSFPS